jgi:hypothetical protein
MNGCPSGIRTPMRLKEPGSTSIPTIRSGPAFPVIKRVVPPNAVSISNDEDARRQSPTSSIDAFSLGVPGEDE